MYRSFCSSEPASSDRAARRASGRWGSGWWWRRHARSPRQDGLGDVSSAVPPCRSSKHGAEQVLLGQELLEVPRELRGGVDLRRPRRDALRRRARARRHAARRDRRLAGRSRGPSWHAGVPQDSESSPIAESADRFSPCGPWISTWSPLMRAAIRRPGAGRRAVTHRAVGEAEGRVVPRADDRSRLERPLRQRPAGVGAGSFRALTTSPRRTSTTSWRRSWPSWASPPAARPPAGRRVNSAALLARAKALD